MGNGNGNATSASEPHALPVGTSPSDGSNHQRQSFQNKGGQKPQGEKRKRAIPETVISVNPKGEVVPPGQKSHLFTA